MICTSFRLVPATGFLAMAVLAGLSVPCAFAAYELDTAATARADGDPVAATTETARAEELKYVMLECSNGDIVLELHPEWAPIGVAHFLELVGDGYYDGAPWFRVIDGFMAQCGFSGDQQMTAQWLEHTILDDEVVQGNKRGCVAYGKSGMPNSRSTHFFINFDDNSFLDEQGFACFAVVVEGMEVVDALYRTGENPPETQVNLAEPGGITWFHERYPKADSIVRAYVLEDYPPALDDTGAALKDNDDSAAADDAADSGQRGG